MLTFFKPQLNFRRRKRNRSKKSGQEATKNVPASDSPDDEHEIFERRNSFPDIEEEDDYHDYLNLPQFAEGAQDIDILDFKKPDLTCISEEGMLAVELEILENITSCNKVRKSKSSKPI